MGTASLDGEGGGLLEEDELCGGLGTGEVNPSVVDTADNGDPIFGTSQKFHRRVSPDMCLIRNVCRGVHNNDFRNFLYGLHYAGIPSVNSLPSIIACQERVAIYAELNRLRRDMGSEAFPFIQATYHPNLDEALIIDPVVPVVVKTGTTCAGYGKMLLKTEQQFMDYKTTLSMGTECKQDRR